MLYFKNIMVCTVILTFKRCVSLPLAQAFK